MHTRVKAMRLLLLVVSMCPWNGHGALAANLESVLGQAAGLEGAGDFAGARQLLATARTTRAWNEPELAGLDFETDRLRRIERDFSLSREDLRAQLNRRLSEVTPEEFDRWDAEGRFDARVIDGRKRYFVSSVSNLFFRHPELETRRREPRDRRSIEIAYWENAVAIRQAARAAANPYVLPKTFRVRMSLDVKPGAVSPGEWISAWLPVPRRFPHQDQFRWEGSEPVLLELAGEDATVRSVFLRRPADLDGAAQFEIAYGFRAHGVWFDLQPGTSRTLDASDPEFARYLTEAPHVRFTPGLRALAAQLATGESDPVRQARAFYDWIAKNIRYSYAPEYSTLENLGETCLASGHGDCGQAAFLFMALCRLSGIPARWQSGWSIFPGDETIHDWCEIHLQPWGWVPVDPYMGMYAAQYTRHLNSEQREELQSFYFGGLSQFRIASNADHLQPLFPPKRWMRSDPVDFQRGEVETAQSNLYFDSFRYVLHWEELTNTVDRTRVAPLP